MGKVPQLRFQQFNSEWTLHDWVETVDISTQMVDPKTGEYDHLPHIGPGNIESFTGKVSDVLLVGQSNLISGKFLFREGDIIYSKIRPNLAKYTKAKSDGLASADAYVLNAKEALSQEFLYIVLQTSSFYNYSVSVSVRTGMPKINRDELNSFSYYAPCREEQQRIAAFLTAIDTKIEQLTQKEALLKQYKKGVMQKIFSQEIRFKADDGSEFPEWDAKKLGEIATFSKGRGISKADISEDAGLPCIRYGELYTDYSETIADIKSTTHANPAELMISKGGEVIIPASGETRIDIARAACVLGEGVALGGDLNVLTTDQDGVFLSYYLNNASKYDIANLAQGVSVMHLYSSQLKLLSLQLPCIAEQKMISAFLTALDQQIEWVITEQKHAKNFKKGLLQQMFV